MFHFLSENVPFFKRGTPIGRDEDTRSAERGIKIETPNECQYMRIRIRVGVCGFRRGSPSLGSNGGQAHHGSEISMIGLSSKGLEAKCYTVHGIFVGKYLGIKEIQDTEPKGGA
jgi:hypothetical protein